MAEFTQEQYDALIAAIAEGVLTVKYQDKLVTYRSLDEMLKLKKVMAEDLGVGGGNRGPFRTVAVHDKQL